MIKIEKQSDKIADIWRENSIPSQNLCYLPNSSFADFHPVIVLMQNYIKACLISAPTLNEKKLHTYYTI